MHAALYVYLTLHSATINAGVWVTTPICILPLLLSLQSSQPDPLELQRQQESRRRAIARKRAREQFRPHSPEAVEGRKHMEVQTELYLEEITDRVEEAEAQTQTDAFLDRPPTPLFVPAKTGVDVATQIEEGDVSTDKWMEVEFG